MISRLSRIILGLALCCLLASAISAQEESAIPDPAPAHPELYPVFQQFGELAGLQALMADFMKRLLADPRTGAFFEEVDTDRVEEQLAIQFCAILGGGCQYEGLDMQAAHTGLGIRRQEFNALVEILQDAMDARGIPFRAQNRLLAKLAPMHREVVGQ